VRERVLEGLTRTFGRSERPPTVIRAPGRVNLIGEHTDYNDGYVLPMAIDRAIWIALRPSSAPAITIHSLDFDQTDSFALDAIEHATGSWADYVRGVAWALQQHGYPLAGWEGVLAGDVPVGAGLSSSAALEMAVALAFAAVAGWSWDPARMARVGQQAENQWIGVNCGIMDQMISASGTQGHALLIDCRSLEAVAVPLPAGASVVVLDTATRRGLVDSEYNQRRAQCQAAARFFGVTALRDVSPAQLEKASDRLDELIYVRARHVVSENQRVLEACKAMQAGDPAWLGRLLNASHASLRDDFQVSSPELDAIVESAVAQPACCGARMTGAGFGGCAVALVRAGDAPAFGDAVAASYGSRTGLTPRVYVCQSTAGAQVLT